MNPEVKKSSDPLVVSNILLLLVQLITLSQKLMAPPAAPHVSGRVIQASV